MSENGAIIYRGPSEIDGAPIIVIATGLSTKSTNGKTGAMVQTWILRDDVDPITAANTGQDVSICGTCPHRGIVVDNKNIGRSCYVTLFQAPRNVWASARRGIYNELSRDETQVAFTGKRVRLGAYGDPAAVPYGFWAHVMRFTDASTGYTHQWRSCDQGLQRYLMASCDNTLERELANAMGWRAFRVRRSTDPMLSGEVVCPASKEAGYKTTCSACVACGGLSAKAKADIVIMAHGSAAKVNAFMDLEAA